MGDELDLLNAVKPKNGWTLKKSALLGRIKLIGLFSFFSSAVWITKNLEEPLVSCNKMSSKFILKCQIS